MLICDAAGIHLLKKKYPQKHKSLGGPVHHWTDANKMEYLFGYVGVFRFMTITDSKIKMILLLEAISLWSSIGFLFFGFYERIS